MTVCELVAIRNRLGRTELEVHPTQTRIPTRYSLNLSLVIPRLALATHCVHTLHTHSHTRIKLKR